MRANFSVALRRGASIFQAPPPAEWLLVAFRLCLGVLVVVDAATRIPDAGIFLTDAGLFPSSLQEPWRPSLLNLADGEGWAVAFLAVYGACGAAIALGIRPRLASLLAWFLVLSIHHRNPCVTNGGDFLLRMTLLWSVFLPLDSGWSLLRRSARPARWLPGVWTIYRVQIAAMYLVTAVHKLVGGAWLGGDALVNALRLVEYARPSAAAIAANGNLLPLLSFAVVFTQLVAGAGLLLRPAWVRGVSVAMLAGMQVGFLVCFDIALFPWIGLVTLIPLLPISAMKATELEPWGWRSVVAVCVATVTISFAVFSPLNPTDDTTPEKLLKLLGLNQRWTMFVSPSPESHRVAVMVGEGLGRMDLIREAARGDGTFTDGPFGGTGGLYPSSRWTAFLVALADGAMTGGEASQRMVARRLGERYAAKFPDLARDGWRVVVFTRDNRTGVAFHDRSLARSEEAR